MIYYGYEQGFEGMRECKVTRIEAGYMEPGERLHGTRFCVTEIPERFSLSQGTEI